MAKSVELSRTIEIYHCRTCGNDTDETVACNAPSLTQKTTSFVADTTKPRPVLGTDAYVDALNERLKELNEEGLFNEKAIYRMRSEGWIFEESMPKADIPAPTVEEIEAPALLNPITVEKVLETMKENAEPGPIDLNRILENMRKEKIK